jgi:hypothetical protein
MLPRPSQLLSGATLLLCAFLWTSCDDGDDAPKGTLDALASFRVPEEHDRFRVTNYKNGSVQAFVFASDEQGNVLTAKEFHPNETVELIPDEPFDGNAVTLTEVYIERNSDADQYTMRVTSYTQLPRGTSWPASGYGKTDDESPAIGQVEVLLRDETPAEDGSQYILSSDIYWAWAWVDGNGPTTIPCLLRVTPSILFVREQTPTVVNPRYKLYDNVVPGQTLEIDEKDLTGVMTETAVPLPASTESAQITLFGLLKENQFDQRVFLGDSRSRNSASVTLYTPPEDKFVQFMSTTSLLGPDFSHTAIHTNATYDVALLDIGLSVATKENGSVTLSTASNLSVMSVAFDYEQGENYSWWVVHGAPGASRQVTLPTLPALVTDALEVDDISLKYKPYSVTGSSYETTPRYTDWVKKNAQRSHSSMDFYRSPENSKSLSVPLN